jgi:TolB protein
VFSHYGSLYTVDVDSGRLRQVTACAAKHACGDVTPVWSPHTPRIVFTRYLAEPNVYLVNADGTGLKRLGGYGGDVGAPLWSPDGQTIAIDGFDGIYTVNADGSHWKVVLSEQQGPALLSWSPDGSHLLSGRHPGYGNAASSHTEVWEMKSDGTGRRRLYRSACCIGRFTGPIWSPDGRYIAFGHTDFHSGATALYVMDKDGHHVHRVIQISPGGSINGGSQLVWQPIP